MKDYKKPSLEGLDKAREIMRKLHKTEPSDEFIKSIEDTQETEEIICTCPFTGTIEIMTRRL